MATKRKPRNLIPHEPIVHQNLRLPKSLHREIKAAAVKNRCSMHAEILRRLVWFNPNNLKWPEETVQLAIRLIQATRADANGQQAATWTTPKSWAEAQKRPPPQERS